MDDDDEEDERWPVVNIIKQFTIVIYDSRVVI